MANKFVYTPTHYSVLTWYNYGPLTRSWMRVTRICGAVFYWPGQALKEYLAWRWKCIVIAVRYYEPPKEEARWVTKRKRSGTKTGPMSFFTGKNSRCNHSQDLLNLQKEFLDPKNVRHTL